MQDITVLKITTYAFVHSCLFLSDFAVHWTDNFWTLSSFFISTEKTKKEKKKKVEQPNDEMTKKQYNNQNNHNNQYKKIQKLSKIIITAKVATQKKTYQTIKSHNHKSQKTPKLQKTNHSWLFQSLGSKFFS